MKRVLILATLTLTGCSRSNNLLLGRVQATVGGHPVEVTDCYRTSVPPPEQFLDKNQTSYRFAPCRDAEILIQGDELTVNGRAYGHLKASDGVLVDHGVVSVTRN